MQGLLEAHLFQFSLRFEERLMFVPFGNKSIGDGVWCKLNMNSEHVTPMVLFKIGKFPKSDQIVNILHE